MTSFFKGMKRPPLVDMVLAPTVEEMAFRFRRGICDGADAFGVQLDWLRREFRTEARLREAFAYLGDRPLYVTNYAKNFSAEMSADERVAELKLAVRCGATLVDVPGDLFAPDPFELTRDARAIDRQRQAIDAFHAQGVEVIMSSHVCKFLPEAEVVELALEHQRRGADIAKFVTYSGSEAELDANFQTIRALKRELKIPFLFLSNGPYCKKHRVLGPYFGVCMWLCTDTYAGQSSLDQPLLRPMAEVVRNCDLTPNVRT